MNSLRRSGLDDFPALTSLNDDAEIEMIKYAELLVDLINLTEEKRYLKILRHDRIFILLFIRAASPAKWYI
jgi:hypothetical protein